MITGLANERHDDLLIEYAAGVLDDARRFMIEAHMQINHKTKHDIQLCEDVGGHLLTKRCTPAPMREDARDKMLERLVQNQKQRKSPTIPAQCETIISNLRGLGLADELIRHIENACALSMKAKRKNNLWTKLPQDIRYFNLNTACNKSKIRLVKVAAGTAIPAHDHKSDEMTLILKGQFKDEYGEYGPGDLIIRQKGQKHAPQIGHNEDCVCLALTYKPLRMCCPIQRIFNLIYRF